MEQVRALYDFAPATAQEVGFAKGDVISNVEVVDENWWRGTTPNGSYGLFPCNYVERIVAAAPAPSPVVVTPAAPVAATPKQLNIPVRALWDYVGQTETELSIGKGDTFTVIEKDDEDVWWNGVYMSAGREVKRGWFPASYVEEVTNTVVPKPAPQPVAFSPPVASAASPSASAYSAPSMPAMGGYGAAPTRTTIPIAQPPQQPAFTLPVSPRSEPPPHKEIKKEKIGKDTFAFLEVHVFECTGLLLPKKGASVQIALKEFGKIRKVFQTANIKKTVEPTWNESFQLNIVDPEETDLVVSVLDGKKAVGEIEFPLRSSKRTQFEEVGGWENKWALQGKEAQGTLHLTIKYRDVNSISKPAQFVKDQSVTSTGGAIITSNLSPEWAKVLSAAELPLDGARPAATPQLSNLPWGLVSLSLLMMTGSETQHQTPAPAPVLAAPIHIPQTTPVAAAAAGFNKPVQPAAAFKPPPPAGPRPPVLAAQGSPAGSPQQFRPPPPAGPRPAPLPGREPPPPPVGHPAYAAQQQPQTAYSAPVQQHQQQQQAYAYGQQQQQQQYYDESQQYQEGGYYDESQQYQEGGYYDNGSYNNYQYQ
ncbi:SH3 domain containing protein [Acanthamoeba castellanii str. Neff]|uniref:SH3 domain containing protein n=1 Tax=Acanthamoeba castellanii (strain ATCC 30010 / Neff) TaxID=1257118 RepID=L8HFD8_ACACF|nr:SH3 domain containing protein [Acanthamoeba castellanii str. Neff]ELR23885.1 SH3 domain containing protein [Acanthamoeba castellanii str. Neff]